MRIFIAGATGAIGRSLVPMLAAQGHLVTAMTRSAERAAPLAEGLATEETPLYLDGPGQIGRLAEAVAELESRTLNAEDMEGVMLRYGSFYGPGTNYDPADAIPRAIRKGRMPIVGDGAGVYSFIHVDDTAAATVRALTRGTPGIYNIVDDDPAPLRVWLPVAASLLGAPAPQHADAETVRAKLGDLMVYIYNEHPGASNAKAKRELG